MIKSVDSLYRLYPNAGIFICGDFNSLDTGLFNRHLRLNQVITTATRGSNILDKFFTDCKQFYQAPKVFSPVGKSDHNCILIRPTFSPHEPASVITTFNRRINDYKLALMADDLSRVNWQSMYKLDDCQTQTDFFYHKLLSIIDFHAPLEACAFKTNDRPWVTAYFKNLILQRNQAFNNGQHVLYRFLKNKVNCV